MCGNEWRYPIGRNAGTVVANTSKLHKIVNDTIHQEGLIINNLLHPPKEILSQGQKLSDRIARFGGSWKFILLFLVIIVTWISYNVMAIGKSNLILTRLYL
ncbi:MAG TPA: hypothetical protein VGQ53_05115 [Chitinophagaceae bacterium]|nr:hypothetical protein [Chitinophagaceae bacterium]